MTTATPEPRVSVPAHNAAASHRAAAGEAQMVEVVFPEQANHYGTLFAGNALNLLSKAAFLSASRHVRGNVVMAACHEVRFLSPVRVGEALQISAQVTRSGRSSMTVQVEGRAEVLASSELRPALEGRFEMVAVDAHGRPRRHTPFTQEETP
ncbi:acyl-CoA thioesterase [Hydrogenophaga palleronii]|uniref:acyl-CoA thioesterase n=1 Tax=Hydrogenophaga palleronii TaxID=65655 RepID=UPI0008246FD0|nr:acyl-CoA thioesterase [Hydrogenophaga palleronii]